MSLLQYKSNDIGALSSFVCLIHCMVSPLFFVVQECTSFCCESTPFWWRLIDYIFLLISFFAVYHSTKTVKNKFIVYSLWISWSLLLIVILNEELRYIDLPKFSIYIPAISLIILHLYNRKYCCESDQC